jgi:hypothetical protein
MVAAALCRIGPGPASAQGAQQGMFSAPFVIFADSCHSSCVVGVATFHTVLTPASTAGCYHFDISIHGTAQSVDCDTLAPTGTQYVLNENFHSTSCGVDCPSSLHYVDFGRLISLGSAPNELVRIVSQFAVDQNCNVTQNQTIITEDCPG